MSKMEFRTATKTDMRQYYGSEVQNSFVALVASKDGEVKGIGGAIWEGRWFAFMDIKPGYEPLPKEVVKATHLALALLGRRALRLFAQPRDDKAIGFLNHYGFTLDNGIYERRS